MMNINIRYHNKWNCYTNTWIASSTAQKIQWIMGGGGGGGGRLAPPLGQVAPLGILHSNSYCTKMFTPTAAGIDMRSTNRALWWHKNIECSSKVCDQEVHQTLKGGVLPHPTRLNDFNWGLKQVIHIWTNKHDSLSIEYVFLIVCHLRVEPFDWFVLLRRLH